MRTLANILFGLVALLAAAQATAAPCAGFTDVDDQNQFCPNVTWLKNRGITLGCTATTYCPNDPVSRLAMAVFMNRLGDSLFPLTCSAGQVMKWNGTAWACSNDATGGGGGTVTSVLAGTGLQGSPNPITGAGSLNLAPGYQLPQACSNGQVPKSNGSGGWACGSDSAGSGTVTSIAQGTGITLSANPLTTSGSIAADTTYLQRRVSSTCAVGSSIRAIAADGTVTCQTGSPGPAGPPGPANRINNQQIALLQWFQDPGRAAVVPVGSYPSGVAFDGSNIWVANGVSDTVSRINPVTNSVIATINLPPGSYPDGLAYDGTYIWVANSNSNTVSRINRTSGVVTPVTVAGSPVAIAFDGTNIWVANFNTNTVSKINPVTATVIYNVSVGVYPNALAFDGTSMWVVNLVSNSLNRIDPNAATPGSAVTGTIPLPPGQPFGIGHDGTYLWVTSGVVNQALKIDPNANPASAVVATVGVGNYPTRVAYDGTSVWVSNSNGNTVSRINPTTNTATTFTIESPVGIAYDGTNLWVVNNLGGGTVSKIIPY